MTINQQSFLVSNMCDEFMVCGCMQVSSDNVLNRAVCGEESRVMFIEGVSAVRRLRKRSRAKSNATPTKLISTSTPTGGEPFLCCQAVASQDGTRNRNRNMY